MQDLRDLFRLEPAELEESVTQRQLDEQHSHQRSYSAALTQHLQFLQGIGSFAGVCTSNHHCMDHIFWTCTCKASDTVLLNTGTLCTIRCGNLL